MARALTVASRVRSSLIPTVHEAQPCTVLSQLPQEGLPSGYPQEGLPSGYLQEGLPSGYLANCSRCSSQGSGCPQVMPFYFRSHQCF